jgi:hypothetical protein
LLWTIDRAGRKKKKGKERAFLPLVGTQCWESLEKQMEVVDMNSSKARDRSNRGFDLALEGIGIGGERDRER